MNKLHTILIVLPFLLSGCVNLKHSEVEEIVGQYYAKNKIGIGSTLELKKDFTFIYSNRIDSFVWETSGVWSANARGITLNSTNSIQKDSSYRVINKGERNNDTLTILLNKGGHYSTNFYLNEKLVRSGGSDHVLIFPKAWADSIVINELWTSNYFRIHLSHYEFDTLYVNTYMGEEFIREFKVQKIRYNKGKFKLASKLWLKKEISQPTPN